MLKTGMQVTNVPYRGAAPALGDLVAGQVQLKLDNYTTSGQLIADRKLNALTVTSPKRLRQLPDVPTVAETIPGFEGYLWMGLMAPGGTSQPIVDKLAAAARKIVASPNVQARFDKDGVESVGGSPDDFRALISREIAQWRELARNTNITVD